MQIEKTDFAGLLEEIEILYLDDKKTPPHHKQVLDELHGSLCALAREFYAQEQTFAAFQEFKMTCKDKIDKAEKQFKTDEPYWRTYLAPILNNIINFFKTNITHGRSTQVTEQWTLYPTTTEMIKDQTWQEIKNKFNPSEDPSLSSDIPTRNK